MGTPDKQEGPAPDAPLDPTPENTTDATDVLAPEEDEITTEEVISSADRIDAVLRDPHVPGDVRAFFVTLHAVNTYIGSVEFYADDNGLTNVRPRSAAA